MSARINVSLVEVLANPARFDDDFQFEITFECFEELPADLEWKLTYVGSAESEEHDQVLDTVLVGPVPEGRHKFVFQAERPDPSRVPASELVGVTVVLLSAAYREREFLKIGYFVRHEYDTEELREEPPERPDTAHLTRYILAEEPRVTRINIPWSEEEDARYEAREGTTSSGFGEEKEEEAKEEENVDPDAPTDALVPEKLTNGTAEPHAAESAPASQS